MSFVVLSQVSDGERTVPLDLADAEVLDEQIPKPEGRSNPKWSKYIKVSFKTNSQEDWQPINTA